METANLLKVTDRVIREFEDSLIKIEMLEKDIEKNQDTFDKLTEEIALFEEVRVFLQQLAQAARKQVAAGLESIVTLCLQSVFGPTMSFEIEIDTNNNNTVIDFFVVNTDGEHTVRFPPEESMGGGVVDTCAIGLRYGILKVLDPEPIGAVILDEPAKMVSGDKVTSIGELIRELNRIFGKQCIVVTHHEPLMDIVDKAIFFEKIDGITHVG